MANVSINWKCTTCGHYVTLGSADIDYSHEYLAPSTGRAADECFQVSTRLYRCPNPECSAYDLRVTANRGHLDGTTSNIRMDKDGADPAGIGAFQFLPATPAPLSA